MFGLPVTLHIVNSFFSFGFVNIKDLRLSVRREKKIPVETNEETVYYGLVAEPAPSSSEKLPNHR